MWWCNELPYTFPRFISELLCSTKVDVMQSVCAEWFCPPEVMLVVHTVPTLWAWLKQSWEGREPRMSLKRWQGQCGQASLHLSRPILATLVIGVTFGRQLFFCKDAKEERISVVP